MKRPLVNQLQFLYDHAADVLHVSMGHPILTNSTALDDNVILQIDPATKQVVGFSIVDFLKRFANNQEQVAVPLVATFTRLNSAAKRRRPARKKSV